MDAKHQGKISRGNCLNTYSSSWWYVKTFADKNDEDYDQRNKYDYFGATWLNCPATWISCEETVSCSDGPIVSNLENISMN